MPRERLPIQAEHWFRRARAGILEAIPCREGCSHCCIGSFPITVLDVTELRRGLASLDAIVRERVERRARGQASTIEESFPRLQSSPFLDQWGQPEIDAAVDHLGELPCPALNSSGACDVYSFRPMTCRMMGIPVEQSGRVQGACEVQTFVPIKRVARALRDEEDQLAAQEQTALDSLATTLPVQGEEVLLPYGFLLDRVTLSETREPYPKTLG